MATNNPKTASQRIDVTRFGGIADHAGLTPDAAVEVRNFRILSDGTLEKRCGYAKECGFSQPLRGLWEGVVSGGSYAVVVSGNTVYLNVGTSTIYRAVYTLTTTQGDVSFFVYNDRLWMIDGSSLLLFRPATYSFTAAQGYVPLYGYNWHPTALGEINEPINLVRNEIRIHYFNSNGSTTFNLPFTTLKINSLKVNGSAITTYNFQSGTSSFTIPATYAAVGSVEVYVTLDPVFSGRTAVLSSMYAKVFRTPHREVAMLYGEQAGYLVYRTSPVSEEMLSDCNLTVSNADPMYVEKDSLFAVGSPAHPVTALCQLEDQMLVFNDENIWTIRYPEEDSNDAEILPIRSGVGCVSREGVTLCGKYPIAATAAGIVRLKFSSSDPDFCQPEILSAGIRKKLGKEFLENAVLFWDEARQELWVRDPSESEGTVWICDPERLLWVRFDHIPAQRIFTFKGRIGFMGQTLIYVFKEEETTDLGSAFTANYVSHFLDLAPTGSPKRSIRLSAVTQDSDDSLTAYIETERKIKSFKLNPSAVVSTAPVHVSRRLSMGRFRFLQLAITVGGKSRCRIFSYSITANP